jgi:predicted acetyltransferase
MMEINFCKPDSSDIKSLKKLWLSSFDEEPKAVDLFFGKCFNAKQTYIAKYGEKIISALYLISASFNGQKAHYLCGASTHKDFRKQGIMSKLIKYALEDSAKSGDKYSFLFPANDNLYNYYQNFGYRENCIAYISDFSRNDLLSLQELNFSENNILKQGNDFKNFAVEYYSTYNIKNVKSKNYFALFEENENTAEVFYFEFEKNNLKNMIK